MDVDWCLSCDRRLDGLTTTSGPYCSPECLSYAQPASSSHRLATPVATPAPNTHRIHQWAAAIPPHVPAGAPSCPFAEASASASTQSTRRSPSPRARSQATPKLIERTSATAPVPTLCVSSPAQVRPLPPTRSTHCAYFNGNTASNTTASMSEASTSLTSLLSEPLVATPDEGDSPFGIGAFVRSWVHRDREHAKSNNEEAAEDIKSYFPPYLSAKTSSPRQKKSKIIQSPSPAPVIRQKFPVMKATHFNDRDRSTPTDSHTPTPVVFPSCRAAEFDWDDDDDDESFVPQAHYHHHFQQKYEPQTRSTSLSPSDSSSGSSILLMAPKRMDARGRRGGRVIAP